MTRKLLRLVSTLCLASWMRCPNCAGTMDSVALASHIGSLVEIDLCGPCHVIWFDNLESAALAPGSVIELFKRIHATRDDGRNLLGITLDCPRCAGPLKVTSDLTKGGRFAYSRCVNGDGRLISFMQFLREKNFIRSLQPHEIARLSVTVKQIRCSSCGGPISLENDISCTHCGAAISVLDEAAVEKALASLQAQDVQRATLDPNRLGEAILATEVNAQRMRRLQASPYQSGGPPGWQSGTTITGGFADLVEMGIGAALGAWLKD